MIECGKNQGQITLDIPKISIIVPVFNAEIYLKKCLDSISNQTFTDFECICINDGSTDSSQSILNIFSKKDTRFKILSQENTGVSNARNKGLKNALGDYIVFVDPDDWLSRQCLEILYKNMLKYNCDIISAEPVFVNDKTKETFTKKLPKKFCCKPIKSDAVKQEVIAIGNIWGCWCKIYKKQFLLSNTIYFQNSPMEDIVFIYDLFICGCSIAFIPDTLYFYRKNIPTSATYNNRERIYLFIETFRLLKKRLQEKQYYGLYKKAFVSHALKCFAFEIEESKLQLKTLKEISLTLKNEFIGEKSDLLYSENIFYKIRILLFHFCLKYNINYAVMGKFLKKIYFAAHSIKPY